MNSAGTAEAGQAVYSRSVLSIYDLWVLGVSNSLLWKCPTKRLRREFVRNVTENHLDVGVGTGYYLHHCLDNRQRRLALLDLNPNSLATAASRARRFNPEIYQANVLDTLDLQCESFDSVSINFLLHCLPGPMQDKSVIFRSLKPHLNSNATIFGSTILGKDIATGSLARMLMSTYNARGIFSNTQDSLSALSSALQDHFEEVEIQVEGCVAIFRAKA